MIINFEEWSLLAKQDQAAFEKKRVAVIRQCINETAQSDAERRRLNGLQFRIDMVRRRHSHALGACIEISDMLMAQFNRLIKLDLEQIIQQDRHESKNSCQILQFRPACKSKNWLG